jgi:hypothetical protein
MNELHDFNKLKRAKKIVKDLEIVMQMLNLAIRGLKPFRDYTSLQETLLCLEDSKIILEIHLSHNKQVLLNKGQVVE